MTNTSDMEALLPPITSSISFLHLQKVFHFSSTSHALNIEVASRHGIFHNLTSFPYSWPLGVSLITNFCKQMHKKSVCSQTCSERVGLPLNRGATISKWSKTSPNRQAKSPRCTAYWGKLVSPDNYHLSLWFEKLTWISSSVLKTSLFLDPWKCTIQTWKNFIITGW